MRKLLVQFDRRRAADTTTLENVDCLVGRLARGRFLVEVGIGFRFPHAEVVAGTQRTFLDDDDREPGAGQDFGGDAATGTAADDDDVGLEAPVGRQAGGIDMLPAGSETCTERIMHHSTFGGPG